MLTPAQNVLVSLGPQLESLRRNTDELDAIELLRKQVEKRLKAVRELQDRSRAVAQETPVTIRLDDAVKAVEALSNKLEERRARLDAATTSLRQGLADESTSHLAAAHGINLGSIAVTGE